MATRKNPPLKHLLSLLYVLAVLLLVALLALEQRHEIRRFSLTFATASTGPEGAVLSLHGEKFHAGLEGVLANRLVNESAQIWHLLPDVATKSIDVKSGLALVSCQGNRLVSFALRDGTPPQVLGSLELPDTITNIKILGERALVAMRRHSGLALVDLRNPDDLRLVAHSPLNGLVASVAVDQDRVYYADLYQGIGRVDPAAERFAPEILVTLESPWRIALLGTRLAVGTLKGKVALFDIAGDGRLVTAGELVLPLNVRGVVLTDQVLAVALADGTLYLYNVSSWPNLAEPAAFRLPGLPLQLEPVPGQAVVAASLIGGGVALVDVSRPAAPQLAGHLQIPSIFVGMKLETDKVWGASQTGLRVFALDHIEHDDNALLAANATPGLGFSRLYAWNGHVYASSDEQLLAFGAEEAASATSESPVLAVAGEDGVSLFTQTGRAPVRRLGLLRVDGGAADARLQDNFLYVVNQTGLRIFSGGKPGELVEVGALPLSGRPRRLARLETGHLLVANLDNEILVVDVSNPGQPKQLASLLPPRHLQPNLYTQDLLVDGRRAFLSQGAVVYVVDVSTPARPELRQIIKTPGIAKSLSLHDDLLLVADSTAGVFMVDVRDRKHVRPVGSWPMPLRVEELAVAGGNMVARSSLGTVWQLPLPQRLRNLEVVSSEMLRADLEAPAKGQYAYLYDEQTAGQVKIETR